MIKSKHFKIHELVPKRIYTARGEKAWALLDSRLLLLIDAMRDEFGRATINDYQFGGKREWSGIRTLESPDYSPTSQHSFGRAVDIIFNDISAPDVRKAMTANPDKWLGICDSISMEDLKDGKPISWVHVDVRNSYKGINLFNV